MTGGTIRSIFLGLVFVLSLTSKTVIAQRHDVCATDVQCLNEGKCQFVDHAESSLDVEGNVDDTDGSNVHRHCVCMAEFGGSRCEKFCPLNCLNGGYCRFYNNNGKDSNSEATMPSYHERFDANPIDYNCECFGYFTGTFCEIPYENCSDGRQCFHGGTCIAAKKSNKKTTCACPTGFDGGSCANDMSVSKVSARGSVSSKSNRHAGPIVAGVLLPMIVAALVYAAFVYRQKRSYSALVGKTVEYDVAELVPRGTARSSGRQQEWRNII
jgi:hypothetical protein